MPRQKTQPNIKPARRKPLNAREHLYSFTRGLMKRTAPIICDAKHSSVELFMIADQYADANKLSPAREGMPEPIWPGDTAHITNIQVRNTEPTINPHEALAKIFVLLSSFSPVDQNTIIGKLLSTIKYQRQKRHDYTTEAKEQQKREEELAYQTLRDFENIMSGNFIVLD